MQFFFKLPSNGVNIILSFRIVPCLLRYLARIVRRGSFNKNNDYDIGRLTNADTFDVYYVLKIHASSS